MSDNLSSVIITLIKMANRLDAKGKFELANRTDDLASKLVKMADSDGSYMSVQNLRSLHEHSKKLLEKIDHNTSLSDWIESKINRASSDILSVSEYMEYGVPEDDIHHNKVDEDNMEENEAYDSFMEEDNEEFDIYNGIFPKNINIEKKTKEVDADIENLIMKKNKALDRNQEREVLEELCQAYFDKNDILNGLLNLAKINANREKIDVINNLITLNEEKIRDCEFELNQIDKLEI